ncbi:hypothetical protein [Pseudomonas purpurea]|uniref:hypothetical protein n=1 Tax=Pseudomonas purpurea TaxID=3136737 RepID=UPI003262E6E6
MKQKMIGSRAQTTRMNDAAIGLKQASPTTFLEKPVELFNSMRRNKYSNQTCRRKKAGNFPAAASYTRFPKGSPRERL